MFKRALTTKDGLYQHVLLITKSSLSSEVLYLFIYLFWSITECCNHNRTKYAPTCNFVVNEG